MPGKCSAATSACTWSAAMAFMRLWRLRIFQPASARAEARGCTLWLRTSSIMLSNPYYEIAVCEDAACNRAVIDRRS